MNQNKGIILSLFNLLNEIGISYAVLRNYETLPDAPLEGSDVDLLIGERSKVEFYNALKDAIRESKSHLLLKFRQPHCDSYFIYRNNPFSGFWIDACTELSTKGFVWASSKFLLEKRIKYHKKDFFVIPPGGEAATVFVKELFSHPHIKERYVPRIPILAKSDRDNFIGTLNPYFGEKTIKDMFRICAEGNWQEAIKKRKKWFAGLIFADIFRNPLKQASDLFGFIIGHLKKIFSSEGMVIAVIGPDGVGKTTTCLDLIREMKEFYFKKTYLYHGHFGFFPEWGNVYRRIFRKDAFQKIALPGNNEVGQLRAIFSILYYGLEYFLAWPWIFWLKLRGNLIFFDRYFYDFVTLNTKHSFPLQLFFTISRMIPRPGLLFVLSANPGTIYSRKKELSLEEIKRQLSVFRNKEITKLTRTVFVNAEEPPEAVSNKIKEEIIKKLAKI
ncbi:MAG: hypothetical protein V1756_00615 [Patescibacteria group bacterium]